MIPHNGSSRIDSLAVLSSWVGARCNRGFTRDDEDASRAQHVKMSPKIRILQLELPAEASVRVMAAVAEGEH